jgi:hypothetical protein
MQWTKQKDEAHDSSNSRNVTPAYLHVFDGNFGRGLLLLSGAIEVLPDRLGSSSASISIHINIVERQIIRRFRADATTMTTKTGAGKF